MSNTLLNSALRLSKAERILLAERIWDSVADQSDAPALTGEQAAELDRRLARLRRTGPRGSAWPVVKKRILRRRKA